jgi:hypothetical protein
MQVNAAAVNATITSQLMTNHSTSVLEVFSGDLNAAVI